MRNKLIRKQIRKISNWSALPLLVYFAMSEALMVAASIVFEILKYRVPVFSDTGFQELILYVLIYLVTMPVVLLIFYKARGKKVRLSFSSMFAKPRKSVGWCTLWIIIAIGLTYAASFITNIISYLLEELGGVDLYEPSWDFGTSVFAILVRIIAPMLFAPFMEEFLFRGTVHRNLEPVSPMLAAVLSGLLFGLWHMNYEQFFYAAVIGIFSALIFSKTRSIIPCIILHFAFNTISTVESIVLMNMGISDTSVLTDEQLAANPSAFVFITAIELFVFALMAVSVILFIVQLVKHRGKAGLGSGWYMTGTGNKLAGVLCAPLMIIVIVLFVGFTVLNALM